MGHVPEFVPMRAKGQPPWYGSRGLTCWIARRAGEHDDIRIMKDTASSFEILRYGMVN